MRIRAFVMTALLALAACGPASREAGNVVMVEKEDAAMAEAHEAARETFSSYLSRMAAPAPGTEKYMVKVRIEDEGRVEHFWLRDIARKGAGFEGVIDNDAVVVRNVRIGQRYAFNFDEVSDWMYLDHGRIKGGYTIRALIPRMPAAQASKMKTMLAPLD